MFFLNNLFFIRIFVKYYKYYYLLKLTKKMKTIILTLGIMLSSSCVLFSQNTTKNNSVNKNKPISDSISTNKQTNPSTQELDSKQINTEKTNDPTTTGSVKKVINGKEVYVKETEINGIKSSVIYEPK